MVAALKAEVDDTPAAAPEPMGPEPHVAAKVVESAPHKTPHEDLTE